MGVRRERIGMARARGRRADMFGVVFAGGFGCEGRISVLLMGVWVDWRTGLGCWGYGLSRTRGAVVVDCVEEVMPAVGLRDSNGRRQVHIERWSL